MKKKLLLMAACLGAMFAFTACGSKDDGNTLTVLNYGKYIESSVLDAFEEETGIHVNYEEYVNPEEMYTKYKSGAIDYDVICTSDYMVERLINEGEAKEINFDKIPLSKNLDDSYFEFSKAFDPENKYSMPYFFGTVGILYNKNKVDANDVKSWDILWNKKYKDQIIMEDSVRDTFVPALKRLGFSSNSTDKKELETALDQLIEQKPLVYSYLVDESADEVVAFVPFRSASSACCCAVFKVSSFSLVSETACASSLCFCAISSVFPGSSFRSFSTSFSWLCVFLISVLTPFRAVCNFVVSPPISTVIPLILFPAIRLTP